MDQLKKLMLDSIDGVLKNMNSTNYLNDMIREGKLAPEDDMVTMMATNLEEEGSSDPRDKESIQVPGYGIVQVGDMKFRLRKMLTESLLNLNKGNFGNLNHHFGLNSVGSSFITTLTQFYNQIEDEQDSNL